jgi:heat shock protein HslJ
MKTIFFAGMAVLMSCYILFLDKKVATVGNDISANTLALFASQQQRDTAVLHGTWFLQPVLPSDTAAGKIPSIVFNTREHRFSGNTGCNTMTGTFQQTDSSLVINERIVTTKMACPGYNEGAFLKSLLRTNRYKIEKGVLILMFDATELSRWTRKFVPASPINKT